MKPCTREARTAERNEVQKKISFFQKTSPAQPSLFRSVGRTSAARLGLPLHEANGCETVEHNAANPRVFPKEYALGCKDRKNTSRMYHSQTSSDKSLSNSSSSEDMVNEGNEDSAILLPPSPDVIHPTPDASRKLSSRIALVSRNCDVDSGLKCNENETAPSHCSKTTSVCRKRKPVRLKVTNRNRLFADSAGEHSVSKKEKSQRTTTCEKPNDNALPLKRAAVTGISPDAKRTAKSADIEDIDFKLCNIYSGDCIPPSQEYLEKNVRHDASQSKVSFSLSRKTINDTFGVNQENLNELCSASVTTENQDKAVVMSSSILAGTPELTQANRLNNLTDESSATENINKANDVHQCPEIPNLLSECTELGEELWDSFENMSPMSTPTKKNLVTKASPFLSNLGRHTVTKVLHSPDRSEVQLHLCAAENNVGRICALRGFWIDTEVHEDDVVNVLAEFDSNGFTVIDDNQGLLIVHPDQLLTGTGTVSTLFCMRKSVLMEKFKGTDPGNFVMVCGILVHELFQEILRQKAYTECKMGLIIKDLLRQPSTLQALYAISCSETEILAEIKKFLPQIKLWIAKYIEGNQEAIKVLDVQDIEENIWSPRFGIKGKIDLTVEVELRTNGKVARKVVPLELKTGKPSFSAEHRGQVMLYTMLCSDRRQDPEEGLLLYLRDGKMQQIPVSHKEKRGLIQLRNELVHYLRQTPADIPCGDKASLMILPPPINNERFCRNCPYLTPCALHLNKQQDFTVPAAMRILMTESTSHLLPADLDYFFHWCHLLELEASAEKRNFLTSIYSESGKEREIKGEGLCHTQLDSEHFVVENTAGGFLTPFACRQLAAQSKNTLDLAPGDMVIVSCESSGEFAVASGRISSVSEKSVQVHLDKNLSLRNDWLKAVFRLDRHEYGSTSGLIAGCLLQLMMPGKDIERFRHFIISQQEPTFVSGLKKEIVRVARPILRSLNNPQIRAVFKSLMANDYLLIKGMPGTGKTTTTVALIRLLHALGHSVLLTSYTHSAVDTILLKLMDFKVDFLRLGRRNRIHPKLLPFAAENLVSKLQTVKELTDFYNSKIIVATTCLGMGHPIFQHRKFDVCVLDEASQVLQPSCLAPILSASKFILVGDPHQLAPLVQSKKARERGMDESLFKRLDSPIATLNLTLQFRMNREIMRLPNELVYNGMLECGNLTIAQATLHLPNKDLLNVPSVSWLRMVIDPSLDMSVLFFDTNLVPAPESSGKNGIQNQVEADLVTQAVLYLLKGGVSPQSIGVISPYRCQVQLLKGRLKQQPNVEVNTVDQYQGRDKEVILLSCVRSTTRGQLGEILQDMRRLNVAISRAKHKLLLFGNKITLCSYPPFEKLFRILRPTQVVTLPSN